MEAIIVCERCYCHTYTDLIEFHEEFGILCEHCAEEVEDE
jgi:hypothetical protein